MTQWVKLGQNSTKFQRDQTFLKYTKMALIDIKTSILLYQKWPKSGTKVLMLYFEKTNEFIRAVANFDPLCTESKLFKTWVNLKMNQKRPKTAKNGQKVKIWTLRKVLNLSEL